MVQDIFIQLDVLYLLTKIPTLTYEHPAYRISYTGRLNWWYASRVKLSREVLYHFAIFTIVNEILIFNTIFSIIQRKIKSRCIVSLPYIVALYCILLLRCLVNWYAMIRKYEQFCSCLKNLHLKIIYFNHI